MNYNKDDKIITEFPEYGNIYRIYAYRILLDDERAPAIDKYTNIPDCSLTLPNGIIEVYTDIR